MTGEIVTENKSQQTAQNDENINNKNDISHYEDRLSLMSTSSTTFTSNDLFAESFLNAHNRFRKLHGAPNLRLSETLCAQAQQWAHRIARKRHMTYCELAGVGECITFFPLNLSAEEIVEYWYEEHRKYEYETPGWQAGTNYFTQIVWHSTTEIGVGRAPVRPIIDPVSRRCGRRNSNASNCAAALTPSSPPHSLVQSARKEWKATAASEAEEEQVVVAFYRPAGNNNRAGQFALNVFKPIAST